MSGEKPHDDEMIGDMLDNIMVAALVGLTDMLRDGLRLPRVGTAAAAAAAADDDDEDENADVARRRGVADMGSGDDVVDSDDSDTLLGEGDCEREWSSSSGENAVLLLLTRLLERLQPAPGEVEGDADSLCESHSI